MNEITIKRAGEILREVFTHGINTGERIPVMLWSGAGVGKSSIVFETAPTLSYKEKPYQVTDLRLSSLNPVDVRGIPYRVEDGVRFAKPYFFPNENENRIIFLDEINTAPPANQVTAYQIARDYSVGENKFPSQTLVVMAGNRAKDKGATFSMPKPLENRLLHLHIRLDIEAFLEWGTGRISTDILSFLRFKPDLLGSDAPSESAAFPTPRTWEYLSTLRKFNTSSEVAEGMIGSGAAREFESFLGLQSRLPDVYHLLDTGGTWTSNEPSLLYAYTSSLVTHLASKDTPERAKNFSSLLAQLPEEFIIFGWTLVKNATKNKKEILSHPKIYGAMSNALE